MYSSSVFAIVSILVVTHGRLSFKNFATVCLMRFSTSCHWAQRWTRLKAPWVALRPIPPFHGSLKRKTDWMPCWNNNLCWFEFRQPNECAIKQSETHGKPAARMLKQRDSQNCSEKQMKEHMHERCAPEFARPANPSASPGVHLLRCESHNSPSCIRKGAGSRRKAIRERHKL